MSENFPKLKKERDPDGLLSDGVFRFLEAKYAAWIEEVSSLDDESLLSAVSSADDFFGELIREILAVASAGHGDLFVERFARHLYDEDDTERALYETYREFSDEGDTRTARTEALNDAKHQGMSERSAERYAQLMVDEPWNERARKGARLYEEAYKRAAEEGRSQTYKEAYADEVGFDEADERYCRLYAEAYEKSFSIRQIDDRCRHPFAEAYAEDFYRHGGDHPCDVSYHIDCAALTVIGKRIERRVGVKRAFENLKNAYFNLMDPYEKHCLDHDMRDRALERAIKELETCIEDGMIDSRRLSE